MKKLIIIILIFGITGSLKAQLNFDTFLEGGVEDANTLLEGYLEPAFLGLGYGLNSGWNNTAQPHKLFGFDITGGVNLAYVPSDAEFFTFNNADYNSVQVTNGTSAQLPTLFGPNLNADDIPELTFNQGTPEEVRFTAPTGAGFDEVAPFNAVPVPFAQIGIGLPKNTELKLRFVPEVGSDDFSARLFGFGILHDFKQWIPGMKLLPFDLSAFFGYTRLSTEFTLDEDLAQTAELNVSGSMFQVLISKKLLLFTPYAGVGFVTTGSDFAMLGEYDDIGTDPISLDYSSGGPRLNVGGRLKLLILTLHVDYAIQKYNTLTAGVGISIR
jgi:hypothetical protein